MATHINFTYSGIESGLSCQKSETSITLPLDFSLSFAFSLTFRCPLLLISPSIYQEFGKDCTESQKNQCLKNFDLAEYRPVFSDIAISLFQRLVLIIVNKIKSMIGKRCGYQLISTSSLYERAIMFLAVDAVLGFFCFLAFVTTGIFSRLLHFAFCYSELLLFDVAIYLINEFLL